MDFYTTILKKNDPYWVALCLENGLVGQGDTKEMAIKKLREAIESFEGVSEDEQDVYSAPIAIKDLHEFLMLQSAQPHVETYELKAIYA